ncbi:putative Exoribonuclease H [Rhodotorula taiwanensis]|uniref:Putative Exoribonuclease H n=1 Tax=Rhodotorula taiwanensis TaxID=741276 RepID=A0A2S5B156_9BASI|nr:putative Exoribonuclease H [Rhodotorula taiwanensis]
MGRTASPKKPSVSNRSLSSRLGVVSAPSPLRFGSSHSASPATSSTGTPVPSIAFDMPAQKRAFDVAVGPATPGGAGVGSTSSSNRSRPDKRSRRQKRKATQPPADTGKESAATATATGDADLEEGEVVEGDFSDLFMVDTTPAAVKPKDRFVPTETLNAATPSKKTTGEPEELVSKPLAAAVEGKELPLAETSMPGAADDAESALDSDDAMRIFAREVAMTDDSDNAEDENDDSDSDEEDEDEPAEEDDFGAAVGQGLMLYDDEEQLQQAIQGRIVDDSAAPTTGRYYKEADLTKTCVLCGEHGHSSRDCTHSQCFICGAIDADHEARNCPVALVCSACGSRGHFARDCPIAPGGSRGSYGQRCNRCGSSNHGAPNCPKLWRIYDTSGPKPPKRKIVLACANCGSGKDHFIDDCMMPRGHPMKHADASAFNRDALGAAGASLPLPSAGPSSSSRRRGGATGKLDMRPRSNTAYEDDAGDDDWFASRNRSNGGGNGGGGGGRDRSRNGGGGRGQQPPPPPAFSGGSRGTHIHFSDSSRNRFEPGPGAHSGSAGRSRRGDYHDQDRDYGASGGRAGGRAGGGGYDSPRDDWRSMYGSERDDRRGGGGGGGGGSGRGTPSLLDRMGTSRSQTPTQHGGGSRRGPSYRGGYV